MYSTQSSRKMSEEGRALLTKSEREILSGDRDVTDNYQHKVESIVRLRVRRRFGEDVEILRENFCEVYEMIEEMVRDEA